MKDRDGRQGCHSELQHYEAKSLYQPHVSSLWNADKPKQMWKIQSVQQILGIYRGRRDIHEGNFYANQVQGSSYRLFASVHKAKRMKEPSDEPVSVRRPVVFRPMSLPRGATKLEKLKPAAIRCFPSSEMHKHSPEPGKRQQVDKFLMRLQSEQILRNGKETERVRALLKSTRGPPVRVRSNPRSLLHLSTLQEISLAAVSPAEAWTQT